MNTGRLRSYITAPRWAGFKELIYELAILHDLDIDKLEQDKGFLSVRIYYELRGQMNNLKMFQEHLQKSMDEWNNP